MSLQFFGQYLVEKGAITPERLAKAVGMQETVNLTFGEIAKSMGLLSSEEINQVNRLQYTRDLLFGEAAVQLGLLSIEQENRIIACQEKNHLYIGEALTAIGAIEVDRVQDFLREFEQEQALFQTSGLDIPQGVPYPDFCRSVGNISHKILSRVAHVRFKPDLCEVVSKIDGNDIAIIFDFTGDINFRYLLTFPRQVRNKIAISLLSTEKAVNENKSLDNTIYDFSNILCGHIINKAAEQGIRLSLLNSEVDDHDKDINVLDRNIGLLFPAYLPTCEWIDIALFLPK